MYHHLNYQHKSIARLPLSLSVMLALLTDLPSATMPVRNNLRATLLATAARYRPLHPWQVIVSIVSHHESYHVARPLRLCSIT